VLPQPRFEEHRPATPAPVRGAYLVRVSRTCPAGGLIGRVLAFRAPGRVNLIGDHTDYNDGFVLPMAIDLECRLRGREAARVRVRSGPDAVDVASDGSDEPRAVEPDWGRYVAGVVRALAEERRPPVGLDADVVSTVPQGSGLSSSAAFEVALALALAEIGGLRLAPRDLARTCQRAEQGATGVPSGIMDQLSSVCGRAGHALLIDCRSLELRYVPLPESLAVIVVHSGLPRELAGTAYADRRAECERDAAELGLVSLRDATADEVAERPRARHVVAENARTVAAADALEAADAEELGRLMDESHASLRDDFEVSTPELDLLTDCLRGAGALGARLTGAGFGGCVVAVARRRVAPGIAREAARAYAERSGRQPTTWLPRAADGAGPLR
jgi:galactokinase